MNKLYIKHACLIALLAVMSVGAFAQVGVGTLEPDNSAILDLSSSTKGFLPPRMSDTQRDAIPSPATGLIIFNTDTECLNFFDGTGWRESCGSAGGSTGSDSGSGSSGSGSAAWPSGYVHCDPTPTVLVEIISPTTGNIWMDRNLGAKQAATSTTDADAFGDLYQWGRFADGHQCRDSKVRATQSTTDSPNHPDFITPPYDFDDDEFINGNSWIEGWSGDKFDRWQGVDGVNNPCPIGFRVPSDKELEDDLVFLNLPLAGYRGAIFGTIDISANFYFTSSRRVQNNRFTDPIAIRLFSSGQTPSKGHQNASNGFSIRCIKDSIPSE